MSKQLTKNFNLIEFGCKDGTPVPEKYIPNVQKLAEQLQVLRDEIGEPIHIISGYRTAKHNKVVGGKPKSAHLTGKAADIMCKETDPVQLREILDGLINENKIQDGGIGEYYTFTHYDIGKARRW